MGMKSFRQFIESSEVRSNEALASILQKHGGQYGSPDEKVKHLSPTVCLHSKKEWGNHRFVKHDGQGNPLAAIQVVSKKGTRMPGKHERGAAHVSTAYTHPDHRRKGYATELIGHAKKMFPKLTYSEHRSGDGNDFVNSLNESAEYHQRKGWMSPKGKSHEFDAHDHHKFNLHPDLVGKVGTEQNQYVKKAHDKGFARYGHFGSTHYVDYHNDAPGGTKAALKALRTLNPPHGSDIEIDHGHDSNSFSSQGQAAAHIRKMHPSVNEATKQAIPKLQYSNRIVSLIHHPLHGTFSHPEYAKHNSIMDRHSDLAYNKHDELDFDYPDKAHAQYTPAEKTKKRTIPPHVEFRHYSKPKHPGAMKSMEDHLKKNYRIPGNTTISHLDIHNPSKTLTEHQDS